MKLTAHQQRVEAWLAIHGPATIEEIAFQTGMSSSGVRTLVARHPGIAKDGKRHSVMAIANVEGEVFGD